MSKDAREFLFLVVAFVVGFLGSLAVCVLLLVRFGWKEMAWWEIVPTVLEMVLRLRPLVLFSVASCSGYPSSGAR